MYAPSRYWYAEKGGTPVKKFETAGETLIKLPDGIKAVGVESADDLFAVDTNISVLTDAEKNDLGVP